MTVMLVGLAVLLGSCIFGIAAFSGSGDKKTQSSRGSSSADQPNKPKQPDEWMYVPGNGSHQIGGMHGKNWGVWVSDGTTGVQAGANCTWSVRSIAPDRPGEVVNEGQAPSGQSVRIDIEPDGDVNSTNGTIGPDNHRIVLITNNCGAWTQRN